MQLRVVSIKKGQHIKFKIDGAWVEGEVTEAATLTINPSSKSTVRSQTNVERDWKISRKDKTFRAIRPGEKLRKEQTFTGTQAALREQFPEFRREYAARATSL